MDALSQLLRDEKKVSAEVQEQTDLKKENFEREVDALIDLYHFIEEHPDEVTKKIMKFMPPVDAQVMAEATRRLRKKLDK